MPRKKTIIRRRPVLPDSRFNDTMVGRFINFVMADGKRGTAQQIVYNTLDLLADKTKRDGVEILKKAIDNVKPILEVKSRRVGGANYQVPVEVRPVRRETLGMRWIIDAARARKGAAMPGRLCDELLDAYNKRGAAIKKRDDVHKMAEANKAFAHYRW